MNEHDEMTTRDREDQEGRERVGRLLERALDAQARGSVPDRRVPPPIDWPEDRSTRRTWLTPLAIAASILVIAGGVTVATTHRTGEAPPATQTGSVTVGPTPSTSPSTSPVTSSPTTSPDPTAPATSVTTSAPASPAGTPTAVGSATLVLPAGWAVRPTPSPAGTSFFCLSPSTDATACSIFVVETRGEMVDVNTDIEGGLDSNPEYCDPATGYAAEGLTAYSDLTISGRSAEYRSWRYVCKQGGLVTEAVQYSVATPTAYVIFSDKATPQVRAVMADLAATATLPAATSPTRLYDHGIVRSVVTVPGGGWEITVDRVIVGWPNQSATTYTYRVPAGVAFGDGTPAQAIGRTVAIHTDGQVVVSASVEP